LCALASKYLLELKLTVAFFNEDGSALPGATEKYLKGSGFTFCLSVTAALSALRLACDVAYFDSKFI